MNCFFCDQRHEPGSDYYESPCSVWFEVTASNLHEALRKIASLDYRGNEPIERRIAREALAARDECVPILKETI